MQSKSGFTGRFRTKDLNDAPFGITTDTQSDIQRDGTSGNGLNIMVVCRVT